MRIRAMLLGLSLLLPFHQAFAETCDFRVGVLTALSGRLAEYGVAVRNGILLAQSEAPEKFRCIKFHFEDDQYEPKQAVSAFGKLLDVDRIHLLYQWGNEPALATAPLAEARKVPSFFVVQHPDLLKSGNHYVHRFINTAEDWQKGLASYLLEQEKAQPGMQFGILKTEMSFTAMLTDELLKQLGKNLSSSFIETVPASETNFRSLFPRLRQKPGDMLGLYLIPSQAVNFLKQSEEQHIQRRYFGSTFMESRSILAPVWPLLKGSIYLHLSVPEDFRKIYKEKFHVDDQVPYAWNAHEFAMHVARRFGAPQDGEMNSEQILEKFAKPLADEKSFVLTDNGREKYYRFPLALLKVLENGELEQIKQ